MTRNELKVKAALAGFPKQHWWPELAPLKRNERNEVLAALNPKIEEGQCLCGEKHGHKASGNNKVD